jgi:hypothetical protein
MTKVYSARFDYQVPCIHTFEKFRESHPPIIPNPKIDLIYKPSSPTIEEESFKAWNSQELIEKKKQCEDKLSIEAFEAIDEHSLWRPYPYIKELSIEIKCSWSGKKLIHLRKTLQIFWEQYLQSRPIEETNEKKTFLQRWTSFTILVYEGITKQDATKFGYTSEHQLPSPEEECQRRKELEVSKIPEVEEGRRKRIEKKIK